MTERWQVAAGVRATEEEDSLLLLSPQGVYYGLDGLGVELWRALAQEDLQGTLLRICETYQVPGEVVEKDAEALFEDLAAAGLVERRS